MDIKKRNKTFIKSYKKGVDNNGIRERERKRKYFSLSLIVAPLC